MGELPDALRFDQSEAERRLIAALGFDFKEAAEIVRRARRTSTLTCLKTSGFETLQAEALLPPAVPAPVPFFLADQYLIQLSTGQTSPAAGVALTEPRFQAELQRCTLEADRAVADPVGQFLTWLGSQTQTQLTAALASPDVLEASRQEAACMEALGLGGQAPETALAPYVERANDVKVRLAEGTLDANRARTLLTQISDDEHRYTPPIYTCLRMSQLAISVATAEIQDRFLTENAEVVAEEIDRAQQAMADAVRNSGATP